MIHLVQRLAAALLVAAVAVAARATAQHPGDDREAARPLRLLAGDNARPLRLLANLDDDDRDGRADATDDHVNGDHDLLDLARLRIEAAERGVTAVRLAADAEAIRLFVPEADGWRPLAADEAVPLTNGGTDLLVECRSWAGAAWDGRATITAVDANAAGHEAARATLEVAAVPVELVPETAPAREVYVARGQYDNDAFIAELREALTGLAVPLVVHEAGRWQEMWMQDTMELAAARAPGRGGSRMTVVLAGLRGVDPFPDTLLGPDVAVADVALPRSIEGGDAWADWYGNLTVSPPTPAWPRGRIISGRNVATGEAFHPEVVAFLAAQRAQPPVWIDTSWLLIKHVDEIVAFLPGEDGRGVMLVADPLAGLDLARAAKLPAAVGPGAEVFAEANRRIAAGIDAMLAGGADPPRAGEAGQAGGRPGLLELLGWPADRVVRLPVAFASPAAPVAPERITAAEAVWSNPVNMLFVNGTVFCGQAGMPEAVAQACEKRFRAAGAGRIVMLDDACYHRAKGNVHCGTNARRE